MIAENDMSGGAAGEGAPTSAQALPVFTVNVRVARDGVKVTLWADDKALEACPAAAVVAAHLSRTVREMAKGGVR